jgi:uncharacterized protein YidB (DUF937 family)
MSFLSDLAQGALEAVLKQAGQSPELQSGLAELLNRAGGLEGLTQKFQQGGLGGVISSWIGTGANEPIVADQIKSVLGPELVSGLASKLGIDADTASNQLASLLPVLIDKLTPDGQVPAQTDLSQVLSGLFKV